MKRHVNYLSIFLCTVLFSMSAAEAAPVFGRYVGVVRHERLKREQLAKLDFIASRGDGNQLELMAVLTLQFGDFKSQEYVSYHFDNVRYNLLAGTLLFDHPGQDMTLKVERFDGQTLTGKIRSKLGGGEVGFLTLARDTPVTPTLPLIEPIEGQYRASCSDNSVKELHLQTLRSGLNVVETGDPFSTYETRGELGSYRSDLCLEGREPCVEALFERGAYNFFKARLVLSGPQKTLTCETLGDTLACDNGCTFKRYSKETAQPRAFIPPVSPNALLPVHPFKNLDPDEKPALVGESSGIEGDYVGYLHHEYLNQYQAASLSIITSQGVGASAGALQMSPVATLYFGDTESPEYVTYKFNERSYPVGILGKEKLFVFERAGAETDAVLQITTLGDGTAKGVWYSLLYGRVGTFELKKQEKLPALPTGAKSVGQMGGWYESSEWDVDLRIIQSESPRNTNNPFFPLVFSGFFHNKDGILPKIPVTGGTYDFYTGKVSLVWDGTPRRITGSRYAPERLKLHFPNRVISSPMRNGTPEVFRYSKNRGEFK